MAVCLQCGSHLIAGTATCVVCGHPRLVVPPAVPRRSFLFGGVSVLTVYALTVISSIPVTLVLYLVPSRDGASHCASILNASACGISGATLELGSWIVYLVMVAWAILLAQRLTEPSLIGPGFVATVGLVLPWMYVVSHLVGPFPLG